MDQFVYFIRSLRDNFITTMSTEEEAIMGRHFIYLKNLLDENKLILAGPCLDGACGIVIISSESEEAARVIMENDPSVREGIMRAELHPYRVSLLQAAICN